MDIKQALRELTKSNGELYCKVCIIDAVDEQARTVDVSPIDESAPIMGVNLQANQDCELGFVLYPQVGTHVVVAFLNDATGVVILSEEVYKVSACIGGDTPLTIVAENASLKISLGDTNIELDGSKKIKLNQGGNGGLVIVQKLTDKINELVETFNNHTHIIGSGAVAVVGSATSQSNPVPINIPAITSKAKKLAKSDYENSDINH